MNKKLIYVLFGNSDDLHPILLVTTSIRKAEYFQKINPGSTINIFDDSKVTEQRTFWVWMQDDDEPIVQEVFPSECQTLRKLPHKEIKYCNDGKKHIRYYGYVSAKDEEEAKKKFVEDNKDFWAI